MANDIKIALNLDGSDFKRTAADAQDEVKSLSDALKKLRGPVEDGLGGAFGSLKRFIGGAVDSVFSLKGAIAGVAAAFAADKIIEAAIEAEQALSDVANSLRLSGELSAESLKDVQDFAAELQDLTGLGDDTTLTMLSLAQSFGLTKDEAKRVVSAANDMSVATGKDLKTSVESLSKSFNGSTKELAKLNPNIKEFTDAQLAAGAAVEALGKQYSGSAAKRLETFGGAVGALKNRFGDLLEEIGFLVTKNPAVVAVVREIESGVKALTEVLSKNADTIRRWVTGAISDFLNGLGLAVRALGLFGESVGQTETLRIPDIFTKAGKAVAFLVDQFLSAKETYRRLKYEFESDNIQDAIKNGLTVPQEAFDNLQRLKDELDVITKARDDLATAVAKADGLTFAAPDTSPFAKAIDDLKKKIDGLPKTVSIDVGVNGPGGGGSNRPDGKTVKGDGAKQGPSVMDASDAIRVLRGLGLKFKPIDPKEVGPPEPPPAPDKPGFKDFKDIGRGDFKAVGLSIAQSLAQNIKNGLEGAKAFISTSLASIADAFLPGIGQIVGPFFQALSDGPEAIKGYLKTFNEAIPQVVENIITALPALTESIFEQGPKIFERLAERAPEIITALIKASPDMIKAIVMNLSDYRIWVGVGEALLQSMVEGFNYNKEKQKEAVQQFKDGVGEASRKVVSGLQQIGPFLVRTMQNAGAALGQFVTELPAKLGAFFQSFFDFFKGAVPELLSQFGAGLQGIGTAFVEGLRTIIQEFPGKFIAAFVTQLQALTDAFVGYVNKVFDALTEAMRKGAEKLGGALSEIWKTFTGGVGKFFESFGKTLLSIPQQIVDGFASVAGGIAGALYDAVLGLFGGGGGGGSNPLDKVTGGFKRLATGGAVVRGAGNRDSVPALLAPGELVLDRTTGPRLNAFIDRAEQASQSTGSSDGTTLALLAKIVDLLQRPVTVETEATVDGRTLADIILKLNRTNQRLA